MSDESEILTTLVELRLGLPGAARGDAAPGLEDSPESEALAADARSLAEAFLRLREETTIPPASEEAQRRLLDHVRKNPPPPPSVGIAELVDLFEGRLSDGEAGSIEFRLASDSHAQKAMPEAAKLAGVLGWLRDASDAAAQPADAPGGSDDALRRLMGRVTAELDGELAAAASEPVRPASTSAFDLTFDERLPRSVPPRRISGSVKFVLGVALAMAAAFFLLGVTRSGDAPHVLVDAARVSSPDELADLAPQLDVLVGFALLDIQAVGPADLADVHLLSRLAEHAPTEESLAAAKFLAGRRGGLFQLLGSREPQFHSPAAFPWENVAFAEASSSAEGEAGSPLKSAIERRDFAKVEALCAGRNDLGGRLLEVWAAVGAARRDDALARLAALEKSSERALPAAAKVYVAGAYRDAGRPRDALARFESLTTTVPSLAFHVGALYKFDLFDETQAGEWFERLTGGLASYAEVGRSLVKTSPILRDEFHTIEWAEAAVDPDQPLDYHAVREGDLQYLAWQSIADELHANALTRGEPSWSDYQVAVDIRFREPESFGRRPALRLFAGWSSIDENYHAVLNRDRLAIGRREPSPLGSRTDVWPAHGEPLLAPSPDAPLEPGRWYSLKMRFQRSGPGAVVAAKVWPKDDAEPPGWAIVVTDHSPGASGSGRIALSAVDCRADFSDLRVDSISSAVQ